MTNLLETAADFLASQRKANATETVVYQRDAAEIADLAATPGKSDFEIDQGDAGLASLRTQDWLVTTADLDFGSGPVEPEPGDRVIATRPGGKTLTYEALTIAGQQCFRYTDSFHRTLRIHTKLIELEQS